MTNAMPKRQEIDVQLTWDTDILFPTLITTKKIWQPTLSK